MKLLANPDILSDRQRNVFYMVNVIVMKERKIYTYL